MSEAWEYEARTFLDRERPREAAPDNERVIYNPAIPGDPMKADGVFLDALNEMGALGWCAFYMAQHNRRALTVYFRRVMEL